MLRKLTNPDCKKKREILDRRATVPCAYECTDACADQIEMLFNLFNSLEYYPGV